ncbi:uncharacterized protein LOC107478346 [Arachis duranensis]|uniref:Uncharacterized protein LOC107478346 n=1 Tax=Arachis duranensis TaxID=130453 RepID=A0A6P4CM80_ARADU|nr:uncharacterized protein LOC107478346 [Arachis duranensis]
MEVCVDDMLVKTKEETDLLRDLWQVFNIIRLHGMRLNPAKCTFAVEAGKFLGFMLTQRGIEVNPDKWKAILEIKSQTCLREVQQLNGRLAALSRFLAGSALRSLPLFSLLRKGCQFEWTSKCEEAFQEFKRFLSQPPILTRPIVGEELVLYLSIADKAVASALIREDEVGQHPIYFTSKVLQGPELRYQKLEKFAYSLVVASRRLQPYFQAHTIKVRTNQPMKQILQKMDIVGRMVQWAIELSEFDLKYETRIAIKAQCLTDFIAEYVGDPEEDATTWELYVDGSSNKIGSDAGLKLAEEVGATKVVIFSDSQVVTSQINREYQAKDPNMKRYLDKTLEHLRRFEETEIKHITRNLNSRADALSKLASTKPGGNNRSLIQKTLPEPSVAKTEVAQDVLEVTGPDLGWMKPLVEYLKSDILPKEEKEAKKIRRKVQNYTLVKNILYKKGISTPLLKCVPTSRTTEVLEEVHNGARYGVPHSITTDNGTQFTDSTFKNLVASMKIKYQFMSVEHPQANGQVETANKVIPAGLKKRLQDAKGVWAEELPQVLWAYQTTSQFATGETPFRPAYGMEAMIPVEINEQSPRVSFYDEVGNVQEHKEELELLPEVREQAQIREAALKQRMTDRYNKKVIRRSSTPEDLVLTRNDIGVNKFGDGKLAANWKGPYKIREVLEKGYYKVADLNGTELPR